MAEGSPETNGPSSLVAALSLPNCGLPAGFDDVPSQWGYDVFVRYESLVRRSVVETGPCFGSGGPTNTQRKEVYKE